MTSKLEDVARALFADRYPETAWDSIEEMEREDYRGHARAALMAMKGPTEEMIQAGAKDCGAADGKFDSSSQRAEFAFDAMIDIALSEKP